jgi:hypothetical protein
MSGWTGVLDLQGDAPPYRVVEACANLGFLCPLDVPWWRVSRTGRNEGQATGLIRGLVRRLFSATDLQESPLCTCGQPAPYLESYTFTFSTHRQARYLIGQCRRCRTVFWDEEVGTAG